MSAYDENHDAAPMPARPEVKLRLRWFPGRYGVSLADVEGIQLSVALATGLSSGGPDEWSCRSDQIAAKFTGTRAEAQAHLEGLVRDRLIKALAAFGEEKS